MSEIVVNVTTPDVVETPYRIEVRCGETTCDVYEHGTRGSGSWAAWIGNGHTIGGTGTTDTTLQQALDVAREHVRREERRRLVYAEVKRALDREAS